MIGKCIKCDCQFVGTPENPPADGLCKYCQIADLQSQLAALKLANEKLVKVLTAIKAHDHLFHYSCACNHMLDAALHTEIERVKGANL